MSSESEAPKTKLEGETTKPTETRKSEPPKNGLPRSDKPGTAKKNKAPGFLTAEEWLSLQTDIDESEVVIGTASESIVRPGTKNLIEAPEKAFKTTFLLRLMLALSAGVTVFPLLPVPRPRKILYVHGELSPREIQERTLAASLGLRRPLVNFRQGRDFRIHLGTKDGQEILHRTVEQIKPDDLVLDPWQAFIPGFDENEFRDVSKATHFLDELIEKFNLTLYLATHTGKDHTRGTRGHSSLAGWRDTLFKLNRKKANTAELLEVTVEPRWARPVDPFLLEFRDGTLWPTGKTGFSPQAEKIRGFLRNKGGMSSEEDINAFLKLKPDALRKALKRAQDEKAIVIVGDEVRLANQDEGDAELESVLTGGQ